MRKIEATAHVASDSSTAFNNNLREQIEKAQYQNLEVEIQYSSCTYDGTRQVYSALIIGYSII